MHWYLEDIPKNVGPLDRGLNPTAGAFSKSKEDDRDSDRSADSGLVSRLSALSARIQVFADIFSPPNGFRVRGPNAANSCLVRESRNIKMLPMVIRSRPVITASLALYARPICADEAVCKDI